MSQLPKYRKNLTLKVQQQFLIGFLTSVTEMRWGSGSIAELAYFTAYIDVYSDEVLTWNIGLHPTVEFVTKPLDELLILDQN